MPHDKFGIKIEFGDWIKAPPYNYGEKRVEAVDGAGNKTLRNAPVVGRIVQMREGQSCSGDMVWKSLEGLRRDAFGADEAELVLKADGSDPVKPE